VFRQLKELPPGKIVGDDSLIFKANAINEDKLKSDMSKLGIAIKVKKCHFSESTFLQLHPIIIGD
jgi:hypothetical protein